MHIRLTDEQVAQVVREAAEAGPPVRQATEAECMAAEEATRKARDAREKPEPEIVLHTPNDNELRVLIAKANGDVDDD